MSTAGQRAADGPHDMAQHERHLGTVRRLAGAQDHRDRLAGGGLVDVDRQEAAAVVVGMEQRQLLAAVDAILGVVDVEHDAARHLGEAVAEQLDHRRHHPLERGGGRAGSPAGTWSAASTDRPPLSGSRPTAILKAGSARRASQSLASAIAGGDQQRAEADHLGEAVADPLGRARVLDAARQPLGEAEPPLDLGQHQHPGVRGQPAAVEGDVHRLAADR